MGRDREGVFRVFDVGELMNKVSALSVFVEAPRSRGPGLHAAVTTRDAYEVVETIVPLHPCDIASNESHHTGSKDVSEIRKSENYDGVVHNEHSEIV